MEEGFEGAVEEDFFSFGSAIFDSSAGTDFGVSSLFSSFFSTGLFSFFSVVLGVAVEDPILRTLAGPVGAVDFPGMGAAGFPEIGARGGGKLGKPLDLVPSTKVNLGPIK